MHFDADMLHEPAQRAVRIVGRELLAKVRETSESVGVEGEAEALHDFRVAVRRLRSWIRAFDGDLSETIRAKAKRRLKRIADATRASRDLEVHIEWVRQFTHSRRGRSRPATEWLLDRLVSRKARADLELQSVLEADLHRAMSQLGHGLSRYIVDLDAASSSFAKCLADLIQEHADAAADAMATVATIGDRAEAHDARIAAKRLRYLVEPLGDSFSRVEPLVERLAQLQDDLGALHDAQIFGSEIAKLLAKELATTTAAASADTPDSADDGGVDDAPAVDRADALRAISHRLHRDERRVFDHLKETWLDGAADDLWSEARAIATKLGQVASDNEARTSVK